MRSPSPLLDRYARFVDEEARRSPVVSAAERPGAGTGRAAPIELDYLPYATAESGHLCDLVASFGSVEAEYAAIRRGAALLDSPQRAVITVRGADRRDFLQRMLTQELRELSAGRSVRAFWLNRKGRIDADLVVSELGDRIELVLDVSTVGATVASLGSFLFNEDVSFEDASDRLHVLELHGPAAGRALALAGATRIPAHDEAAESAIGGVDCTLVRSDTLGEHGWIILVCRDRAGEVWDALLAAGERIEEGRRRVRPCGWLAMNIARIEAGTPLFLIDFSSQNLPHETGVLHDRVSFRKGCYLGQEVVARMESLGKPKQMLVGLRPARDLLPVAEGQVFERVEDPGATGAAEPANRPGAQLGTQIGAVTSSTLSPMLSAAPIAFAMVRTAFAVPGTRVLVNAEGEQCEATVGPLRFWPEATS